MSEPHPEVLHFDVVALQGIFQPLLEVDEFRDLHHQREQRDSYHWLFNAYL